MVKGVKGGKGASKRKPVKKKVQAVSPAATPPVADELTPKLRMFAEYYIGAARFNGTQAARLAGYNGDDNTLASIASQNLRKLKVKEFVASRLDEAAMSANEVLSRLSAIARGDLEDVVDEDGRFDFDKARQGKKTGLLKKLKRKTTSKRVDARSEGEGEEAETIETSVIHEEVEFEMYSAHEALRDLGKYHKLFTEKHEHSGEGGKPIPIAIIEAIKPQA